MAAVLLAVGLTTPGVAVAADGGWPLPSLRASTERQQFAAALNRDLLLLEAVQQAVGEAPPQLGLGPGALEEAELAEMLRYVARATSRQPWRLDADRFAEEAWRYLEALEEARLDAERLYEKCRAPPVDGGSFWEETNDARTLDALELLARQAARARVPDDGGVLSSDEQLARVETAVAQVLTDPQHGAICRRQVVGPLGEAVTALCAHRTEGVRVIPLLEQFAIARSAQLAASFIERRNERCRAASERPFCRLTTDLQAMEQTATLQMEQRLPLIDVLLVGLKSHYFAARRLLNTLEPQDGGGLPELDKGRWKAAMERLHVKLAPALKMVGGADNSDVEKMGAAMALVILSDDTSKAERLQAVLMAASADPHIAALLPRDGGTISVGDMKAIAHLARTALPALKLLQGVAEGQPLDGPWPSGFPALQVGLESATPGDGSLRVRLALAALLPVPVSAPDGGSAAGTQELHTGLVSEELEIPLPHQASATQIAHTLKAVAATAHFKAEGPTTQDLIPWFNRLDLPRGAPIERALLEVGRGLELRAGGSCFFVSFGPLPASRGGCTLSSPAELRGNVLDALRQSLAAKAATLAAELHDKLPPLGVEFVAPLKQSLTHAPLDCDRGTCTATISLQLLNEELRGGTLTVVRDPAGNVSLRPPQLHPRNLVQLAAKSRLVGVKDDASAGVGVTRVVLLNTRGDELLDLGLAKVQLPDIFEFLEVPPAPRTLRLSSGFSIELDRVKVKLKNGVLVTEHAMLHLPPPFEDLSRHFQLTAEQRNGVTRWTVRPQLEADKLAVLLKVNQGLQRIGLLPAHAQLDDVWFDEDGLHTSFAALSTLPDAERRLVDALSTIDEGTLRRLPTLVAESGRVPAGESLAELRGWITTGVPQDASVESLPGGASLRYRKVPGRPAILAELTLPALGRGVLKLEVTQQTQVLVNEGVAQGWITNWLQRVYRLSPSAPIRVQVAEDSPLAVVASTQVSVGAATAPLSVRVGLDGSVSVDSAQLGQLTAALNSTPVAELAAEQFKQLQQKLRGSLDPAFAVTGCVPSYDADSLPAEAVLTCKLNLPIGLSEPVELSDIAFRQHSGWDFGKAKVSSPEAVRATLERFAPSAGPISLRYRSFRPGPNDLTLILGVVVELPELGPEVRIETDIEVSLGHQRARVDLDVPRLLAKAVGAALSRKLLPWEHRTDRSRVVLESATEDGGNVIVAGSVDVATDLGIAIPFKLILPVSPLGPPRIEASLPKLDVAGLLKVIDLPLLSAKGPIAVSDVRLLDRSGAPMSGLNAIPRGIRLNLRAQVLEQAALVVRGLEVSGRGVAIEGITVELPGVQVPIPPVFMITEPSITIARDRLAIRGKLTVAEGSAKYLVHLDGEFGLNPSNLVSRDAKLDGSATLVLFSVFPLGHNVLELWPAQGRFRQRMELGGVLSRIVRAQGEIEVEAFKLRLAGKLDAQVFGASLAEATVDVSLLTGAVLISAEAHLPNQKISLMQAKASFIAERGFKRPMLRAEQKIKLAGFTLSRARIEVSLQTAALYFSFLGIDLGLVMPSLERLTPAEILKLLARLLSPEILRLDKALLAILSGNFVINPFASFGPDSGGVSGPGGDSGSKRDGSGQGSGGDGRAGDDGALSRGDFENLGASTQTTPAPSQPKLGAAMSTDAAVPAPALMPPGEFSFPIVKDGEFYLTKLGKGLNEKRVRLVESVEGTAQWQRVNADTFGSAGTMLAVGYRFLAHMLDQSSGSGCSGVAYLFAGSPAEPPRVGRVALSRLGNDYCYSALRGLEVRNPRALVMASFLEGTAYALRPGPTDQLEELSSLADGSLIAVLARHRGEMFHRVYVTDSKGDAPVVLTIRNLAVADRASLLAILRELLARPGRTAALSRIKDELFVRTPRVLEKLQGGKLVHQQSFEWEPEWTPPITTAPPPEAETLEEEARAREQRDAQSAAKLRTLSLGEGAPVRLIESVAAPGKVAVSDGTAELAWLPRDARYVQGAPGAFSLAPSMTAVIGLGGQIAVIDTNSTTPCTIIHWFSGHEAVRSSFTVPTCVSSSDALLIRGVLAATETKLPVGGGDDFVKVVKQLGPVSQAGQPLSALVLRFKGEKKATAVVAFGALSGRLQVSAPDAFWEQPDFALATLREALPGRRPVRVITAKGRSYVLVGRTLARWAGNALAPVAELSSLEAPRRLESPEAFSDGTATGAALTSFLESEDLSTPWMLRVAFHSKARQNTAILGVQEGRLSRWVGHVVRRVAAAGDEVDLSGDYQSIIRRLRAGPATAELHAIIDATLAQHREHTLNRCALGGSPRDIEDFRQWARDWLRGATDEQLDRLVAGEPPDTMAMGETARRLSLGALSDALSRPSFVDAYLTFLAEKAGGEDAVLRLRADVSFILLGDQLWAWDGANTPELEGALPHTANTLEAVLDVVAALHARGDRMSVATRLGGSGFPNAVLIEGRNGGFDYVIDLGTQVHSVRLRTDPRYASAKLLRDKVILKPLSTAPPEVKLLGTACTTSDQCRLFLVSQQRLVSWDTTGERELGPAEGLEAAAPGHLTALLEDLDAAIKKGTTGPLFVQAFPTSPDLLPSLAVKKAGARGFTIFSEAAPAAPVELVDDRLAQRPSSLVAGAIRLARTAVDRRLVLGDAGPHTLAYGVEGVFVWAGDFVRFAPSLPEKLWARFGRVARDVLPPAPSAAEAGFVTGVTSLEPEGLLMVRLTRDTAARFYLREESAVSLEISEKDLDALVSQKQLTPILTHARAHGRTHVFRGRGTPGRIFLERDQRLFSWKQGTAEELGPASLPHAEDLRLDVLDWLSATADVTPGQPIISVDATCPAPAQVGAQELHCLAEQRKGPARVLQLFARRGAPQRVALELLEGTALTSDALGALAIYFETRRGQGDRAVLATARQWLFVIHAGQLAAWRGGQTTFEEVGSLGNGFATSVLSTALDELASRLPSTSPLLLRSERFRTEQGDGMWLQLRGESAQLAFAPDRLKAGVVRRLWLHDPQLLSEPAFATALFDRTSGELSPSRSYHLRAIGVWRFVLHERGTSGARGCAGVWSPGGEWQNTQSCTVAAEVPLTEDIGEGHDSLLAITIRSGSERPLLFCRDSKCTGQLTLDIPESAPSGLKRSLVAHALARLTQAPDKAAAELRDLVLYVGAPPTAELRVPVFLYGRSNQAPTYAWVDEQSGFTLFSTVTSGELSALLAGEGRRVVSQLEKAIRAGNLRKVSLTRSGFALSYGAGPRQMVSWCDEHPRQPSTASWARVEEAVRAYRDEVGIPANLCKDTDLETCLRHILNEAWNGAASPRYYRSDSYKRIVCK